ncbi:sugar:proton symporter [Flavobacterium akiainvivens]|uniref:Sugar:proton symporter n=1 Tax=Flavobacterium akiainvivens TaxID=1202724 RepID=A0A0M8MH22_9FLAO|nr:L-rhamnose/proton symporter RhaT [Flavobacterium akiainvivens]KOS05627.1 sugar:proton symporter [Flavobacterium akiainvivens]SFQ35630.1 L-rhamnose-H+ transport protein [Flavobacterium akiainvivens]
MSALLGVIFHFIGGFASGSFYIPFKKVKGWSWETYWLVGGIFSWLIVPPLAAWLTIPDFWNIIAEAKGSVIVLAFLFGVLWGIGGFTYGLGVRYLGVALGSSVILGLCMVFGSLLPSIYYEIYPEPGKDSISAIAGSAWGQMVLLGLFICIIAIVICGKAGVMKEKQLKVVGTDPHGASVATEYKFGLGLLVSIISGVLSACFNFGLEAGKPMADVANELWKAANPGHGEFLFQNNVTYIVVLWGGLLSNLVGCLFLAIKNKTLSDYRKPNVPVLANIIFCALAGTTWFLQFFFYGMGESRMGNGPSSWILHMAFIIFIANLWGIILKEWKGVNRKTVITITLGILAILLSVMVVGYGNSLK